MASAGAMRAPLAALVLAALLAPALAAVTSMDVSTRRAPPDQFYIFRAPRCQTKEPPNRHVGGPRSLRAALAPRVYTFSTAAPVTSSAAASAQLSRVALTLRHPPAFQNICRIP
jgi:hypothetical protein